MRVNLSLALCSAMAVTTLAMPMNPYNDNGQSSNFPNLGGFNFTAAIGAGAGRSAGGAGTSAGARQGPSNETVAAAIAAGDLPPDFNIDAETAKWAFLGECFRIADWVEATYPMDDENLHVFSEGATDWRYKLPISHTEGSCQLDIRLQPMQVQERYNWKAIHYDLMLMDIQLGFAGTESPMDRMSQMVGASRPPRMELLLQRV